MQFQPQAPEFGPHEPDEITREESHQQYLKAQYRKYERGKINLTKLAKNCGFNPGIVQALRPQSLDDFLGKDRTGVYKEMSAAAGLPNELPLCTPTAASHVLASGISAKYNYQADAMHLEGKLENVCPEIMLSGCVPSELFGIYTLRYPQGQMIRVGKQYAFRLSLNWWSTMSFRAACEVMAILQGEEVRAVITQREDQGGVPLHASVARSLTRDGSCIKALDSRASHRGRELSVNNKSFYELILLDPVLSTIPGAEEVPAANPDYLEMIQLARNKCKEFDPDEESDKDVGPDEESDKEGIPDIGSDEGVRHPRFLFVGNPGTGKTTMINCIAQKVMGKAGLACGIGITIGLDWYDTSGPGSKLDAFIGDTPGLDDPNLREVAARSIEAGLREDEDYHLVFFCKIDDGRIRGSDVSTVALVLDALKSIPHLRYSIVFNKVKKRSMRELQDQDTRMTFETLFFSELQPLTDSVFYLPEIPGLDDEDNVVIEPPADFVAFIRGAPSCAIPRDDVGKVDETRYAQLAAEKEGLARALGANIEEMKKATAAHAARLESHAAEIESERRKAQLLQGCGDDERQG